MHLGCKRPFSRQLEPKNLSEVFIPNSPILEIRQEDLPDLPHFQVYPDVIPMVAFPPWKWHLQPIEAFRRRYPSHVLVGAFQKKKCPTISVTYVF